MQQQHEFGGKQWTFKPRGRYEGWKERYDAIQQYRRSPMESLADIPEDLDDETRKQVVQSLVLQSLDLQVISPETEIAFDESMEGFAFKLSRALREDHPDISDIAAGVKWMHENIQTDDDLKRLFAALDTEIANDGERDTD